MSFSARRKWCKKKEYHINTYCNSHRKPNYRISNHSFPGIIAEISSGGCKQLWFTVLGCNLSVASPGIVASLLVLWMILDRPGKPPRNENNCSTQEQSGLFLYTGGQILIPRHFKKHKWWYFSQHYCAELAIRQEKWNVQHFSKQLHKSKIIKLCTAVWSYYSLMENI